MEQFARQEIIPGWNQEAIRRARVLLAGRGWLGCFTAWGLISLGLGELLWLGTPEAETKLFEQFLLSEHAPGLDALVGDYILDARTAKELRWIFPEEKLQMMIVSAPEPLRRLVAAEGRRLKTPVLNVGCHEIGISQRAHSTGATLNVDQPIPAMLAGALAIDEFRQTVNPLELFGDRERGHFELAAPQPVQKHPVVLVGAGGIGVYCAILLAALSVPLILIDCDTVEMTNLNRQGLFSSQDATENKSKANAAAARLRNFFPKQKIRAVAARIDRASVSMLRSFAPSVIISAVDNAVTRLALSEIGVKLALPVVQAGTDVFAADCFAQAVGGPILDEQMHGAMSAAARNEASRRQNLCTSNPSYVVPGMIAGAFAAAMATAFLNGARAMASLHWRSGSLPRKRKEFSDEFASSTL